LRKFDFSRIKCILKIKIKVDSKTEEFLKQWREQKKSEWIENLKRRGVEINLEEIKKRESNGEPLEWELQLINKDSETRKLIFDIMTQKNEIEMYAKANERPEDFLKDIKDLTTNPFSKLNQHIESERERERQKRKQNNLKKLEKIFKEEEYKWEKHEETKEKERQKLKHFEEDLLKRKKRLLEKDLNYESSEEKKKIKSNPKFFEEYKQMRIKEREFDEMMRRKENPKLNIDEPIYHEMNLENNNVCTVTDLALKEDTQLVSKEKVPKTEFVVIEYHDEEDYQNISDSEKEYKADNEREIEDRKKLILNIGKNLKKSKFNIEDYEDENDPYHRKIISNQVQIDEETEKHIMEISQEINNERKEEEKRQIQKQTLTNLSNETPDNKIKAMELQKQVFEMIPREKEALFKFPINWVIVFSVK